MGDVKYMKDNRKVFLAILLIVEILLIVYMAWHWGNNHLCSDNTAELVLAELLNREGGILSKNWYYSTELRVLNTQLVMAPLFSFFSDWHVIRAVGTGILLVILLLSWIFLCRSLSLGKYLIYLSPLILWPFSGMYMGFVLFGLYYIPHLVILFISLGLCLNNFQKLKNLRLLLLVIIAFIAGLGGIRMVVVCYLPLFAATVFSVIPFFRSKGGAFEDPLYKSFLALAASFAGLFINNTILVELYSFITMVPTHLSLPHWERLPSVLKSVPFFLGAVRPVFSFSNIIVDLMVLLLCLLIACMSVRLVLHWKSLSQETHMLLLLFLFSFLITAFSPIISTQWWSNRYIILPAIGYLVIIAAYMDQFKLDNPKISKSICALILIASLFTGFNQCFSFARSKRLPQSEAAYSYIINSGMEFGFGDWDTSDLLTELSNGRIRLCKIVSFKNMDPWYWLMEKDFQKYAKGKPVFLIMNNGRLTYNGGIPHLWGKWTKNDLAYLDAGQIVFQDKHYTVWRYETYEQLEQLVGKRF